MSSGDRTQFSQFENGFTRKYHNFSWNHKDSKGLLFVLAWCLFLSIVTYSALFELEASWQQAITTFNLCWLATLVGVIYQVPIVLLYAASFPIALYCRTPAFLEDWQHYYFPRGTQDFENPSNFKKIRREVLSLLCSKRLRDDLIAVDAAYGRENCGIVPSSDPNGWKLLPIKSGHYTDRTHCPFIASLVERDDNIVSCIVSVLEPGMHIPMHIGYYKGVIRYLLGVVVPMRRTQVYLCANGEKRSWEMGRGILFDDTYPHKVYNNTNQVRVVLYLDVRRRLESPVLSALNNWIVDRAMNSEMVKREARQTETKMQIRELNQQIKNRRSN